MAAEVEYVGTADEAKISAADWRAAGVTDQEAVAFNRGNSFRVPVTKFNEKALEVLRKDNRFKVPARA